MHGNFEKLVVVRIAAGADGRGDWNQSAMPRILLQKILAKNGIHISVELVSQQHRAEFCKRVLGGQQFRLHPGFEQGGMGQRAVPKSSADQDVGIQNQPPQLGHRSARISSSFTSVRPFACACADASADRRSNSLHRSLTICSYSSAETRTATSRSWR